MYATLTALEVAKQENGRHEDLRRYARWEYGQAQADWLFAAARAGPFMGPRLVPARARRPLGQRLRGWFASLRGPDPIDVRRGQDPAQP
ncbi:MAG TPA: hypothetical protein VJ300_04775 [Thermoplasmata archaeon]|nr:hypothetical protein [Thermoplasmata archaeon]